MHPDNLWGLGREMRSNRVDNEARPGPTKEQTLEEMRNQGNPNYWHRASSTGGKVSATKGDGRKRQRVKRLKKKATRRKNR